MLHRCQFLVLCISFIPINSRERTLARKCPDVDVEIVPFPDFIQNSESSVGNMSSDIDVLLINARQQCDEQSKWESWFC